MLIGHSFIGKRQPEKRKNTERMKKGVKKIGKSLVEWCKLYNFAAKFE